MVIDRESSIYEQKLLENFIPDNNSRNYLLRFLANSISYANSLDFGNWNVNMDKNGQFIRFNVGQEYCIDIDIDRTLILCQRSLLTNLEKGAYDINFLGYLGKTKIVSKELNETPDCLVKVPGSIGCIIDNGSILKYLENIKDAHRSFISYAIKNTKILTKMKNAHSDGVIEYITATTKKRLSNPIYKINEEEFHQLQEEDLIRAKKLSDLELQNEVDKSAKSARKIDISTSQYIRNPFVAELVKRQAKGICQDCKQPAPFISKQTNEPYLESHHIQSLSDGGLDIIDNVIALCPNCHRKRHYG